MTLEEQYENGKGPKVYTLVDSQMHSPCVRMLSVHLALITDVCGDILSRVRAISHLLLLKLMKWTAVVSDTQIYSRLEPITIGQ